jgi:hypothetical protein
MRIRPGLISTGVFMPAGQALTEVSGESGIVSREAQDSPAPVRRNLFQCIARPKGARLQQGKATTVS